MRRDSAFRASVLSSAPAGSKFIGVTAPKNKKLLAATMGHAEDIVIDFGLDGVEGDASMRLLTPSKRSNGNSAVWARLEESTIDCITKVTLMIHESSKSAEDDLAVNDDELSEHNDLDDAHEPESSEEQPDVGDPEELAGHGDRDEAHQPESREEQPREEPQPVKRSNITEFFRK